MSSPAEVQGYVTVCVHYQDSEHGPVLQFNSSRDLHYNLNKNLETAEIGI